MTEIPLKQWIQERATIEGVSRHAIYWRLCCGKYLALKLRRVNKRVVFVQVNGEPTCPTCGKPLDTQDMS